MNIINIIKRVLTLSIILIMLNSITFSACALELSDWPSPFMENGVVSKKLAIIVGRNASQKDVLGALDIMQSLVEGDSVQIRSNSNSLDIGKSIGNDRESLTEVDLTMLRGGQIVTNEGSTEYNQYLQFPDNGRGTADPRSGAVQFGYNENNILSPGLAFLKSTLIFTWILEFEQGLRSRWNPLTGRLRDIEDESITILGEPFVIVYADLPAIQPGINNNPQQGLPLTLELLSGHTSAVLGENEIETFVMDDMEYEIEVLVISETSNTGEGSVKFRINGEITDELEDGDIDVLVDGTQIGIRDIITTGKDVQKSIVQFYLGANKISFSDTITNDTAFVKTGVKVNQELIDSSNISIRGNFDAINNIYEINEIHYNLFARSVLGHVCICPGMGLRDEMDEPEGLLTPNWDIKYRGLIETENTLIRIDPDGNSEYNLEWTNQEGIFYEHPLLSNRKTGVTGNPANLGGLVYGDNDNDLWFTECMNNNSAAVAQIKDDDYFIVSNCFASPYNQAAALNAIDDTCFSHVFKYNNLDTNNREITFSDLGVGTRTITYNQNTNLGSLVVGGVTYRVWLNTTNNNIAVDLNGDGVIASNLSGQNGYGKSLIAIKGEGLIDLGWQICVNSSNWQAWPRAQPMIAPTNAWANGTPINSANISIITLAKEFNNALSDEVLYSNFTARQNNMVGIGTPDMLGTSGIFYYLRPLEQNEEVEQGLSGYGIFVEMFNPGSDDKSESFSIEYPLSQRGAVVMVTGDSMSAKQVKEIIDKDKKITKHICAVGTDDEFIDIYENYNAIVVGGPCANSIASKLLDNPSPCWDSVKENCAIIRLFEHSNNNAALLINGDSSFNTQQGCRAVASGIIKNVNGRKAKVTGISLSEIDVNTIV